jgi:hypothetical protein
LNLRQIALVGLAALALGGTAVAAGQPRLADQAATPPPPPPPNGSVATPGQLIGTPVPATAAPGASASPAPAGRRGRRAATPEPGPSASESPAPPQFSTMDGVWEVQLQPLMTGRTIYSHLYVTQAGDALTGTWVRGNNEKLAFTGTFDGRLFKLTATDAKKAAYTLSGYAENFSDMVGMVTTADPKDRGTPFTAAHRKKEKFGY